ncbi:MAG: response regulator [Candidatus Zixiibacteriota bacterium]|nr:MAG: response regulator [candidate division Zixibacteria bacterium]
MIRILVIDDSEVIRRLLEDYLTDLGYRVDTAEDGLKGVEKALAGDYQIIICDMHMPKKDGPDVYSDVTSRKPDVAFIMTDSLPGDTADTGGHPTGWSCLRKPFDLAEVQQMLDSLRSTIKTR